VKAEDLNQEEFNYLVQCAKQRQALVACVVGVMESPATTAEMISVKNAVLGVFMQMISVAIVNDSLDHDMATAMKSFCAEQIEINSLLDSVA
jgi:hypothetical protein